ncbi:NUDIX hydrolase [Nonomuraea phyllanthi]|uniref:NUDIX hydrolase n=1 Tax=Nonomuraea phyllanthi TaxID=2219224 RepID=UPI001D145E8C|nr:NUDIX hydrolase [Nonomuraea phyllanthi]
MIITKELRVAAYAICVDDGRILLTRWVGPDGERVWTLPGGGLEHAEDPVDAAIREVEEETGYTVAIEELLGMSTLRRRYPRGEGREADFHGLRIYYVGRVTGGTLRAEIGGSSDRAEWVPLDRVAGLDQSEMVGVGLELHRLRPRTGRLP